MNQEQEDAINKLGEAFDDIEKRQKNNRDKDFARCIGNNTKAMIDIIDKHARDVRDYMSEPTRDKRPIRTVPSISDKSDVITFYKHNAWISACGNLLIQKGKDQGCILIEADDLPAFLGFISKSVKDNNFIPANLIQEDIKNIIDIALMKRVWNWLDEFNRDHGSEPDDECYQIAVELKRLLDGGQ